MFKKNANVTSSRPLSGKDVKTLRTNIRQTFEDLSAAELDELVPAKCTITLHKLANRVEVYGLADGGPPLFFEAHERLLPTMYTLWRLPHILPRLDTYSEVSPKVLGGADLFLQGVIVAPTGLPSFRAGDLMALYVQGHPMPFAVGSMETSTNEARSSSMKGRGIKVAHSYGDLLWLLGPQTAPDPSFKPERIFPYDPAAGNVSADEESTAVGMRRLQISKDAVSVPCVNDTASRRRPAGAGTAVAESDSECETSSVEETDSSDEESSEEELSEYDSSSSKEDSSSEEDVPAVDINDPDALAVHCLLMGLHSVGDSQLPMAADKFYAQHILPAKPEGATLDLKKSSFKKVTKLLTAHEKKKLLKTKLVHKVESLVAVDRKHEMYTSFTHAAMLAESASEAKPKQSAAQAQIAVTKVYRVPSSLQPVFAIGSSCERSSSRDALFSVEEVAMALQEYAVAGCTAKGADSNGRPQTVALDRLLVGNLFNKKEPEVEGDRLSFDHTLQRLLKKLQTWSRITCTTPLGERQVLKKGDAQPVLVQLEDRAGGRKHITRISGMETYAIDPDELATALQRRFQSSASVAKLPGKAADIGKEIALQGDCLQGAAEFITSEFGLPGQFITQKSRSKG